MKKSTEETIKTKLPPVESAADFLAKMWQDTVSHEILYKGKSLVVELEIKPSEAIIATKETSGTNSVLMQKVFQKVLNDEKFRSKLNGKKLESLGEAFDNPSEILDYMMSDDELLEDAMNMGAADADSIRSQNKNIVISCAVNPRFTTHEDFKLKKEKYLSADIKTFPVEFISDMDLQTLANLATGKHVVWEEKSAEGLANFSLPQ